VDVAASNGPAAAETGIADICSGGGEKGSMSGDGRVGSHSEGFSGSPLELRTADCCIA
jgi:hypothetical protein